MESVRVFKWSNIKNRFIAIGYSKKLRFLHRWLNLDRMSADTKQARIAAIVEKLQGRQLDAHYLGYFECFNQQLYYEAHEVLEQIWLPQRAGSDGAFYKGLIQLAGAFVHLQKARPEPAKALLRLAEENLRKYPPMHQHLDLTALISEIRVWREKIESATGLAGLLLANGPPKILLVNT